MKLRPADSGFITALADKCRAAFAGAGAEPTHLLLSYHAIPTRYDRREGGRYRSDCRATSDPLLARRIG